MFRKDPDKKRAREQYVDDLTYLSGGPPRKSGVDKIAFYLVFAANAISYNEQEAHEMAERLRGLAREDLERRLSRSVK